GHLRRIDLAGPAGATRGRRFRRGRGLQHDLGERVPRAAGAALPLPPPEVRAALAAHVGCPGLCHIRVSTPDPVGSVPEPRREGRDGRHHGTPTPGSGRVIQDFRSGSCPTELFADVCIVGAGPAGIALATALAGSRWTVCLLEGGGPCGEVASQALNEGESVGPYALDPAASRLRAL